MQDTNATADDGDGLSVLCMKPFNYHGVPKELRLVLHIDVKCIKLVKKTNIQSFQSRGSVFVSYQV